MGLHPNLIDFSIMGYNGNLWQRLPQVTVRHQFSEHFDGLVTAFRFERGLSAIQPQTQRRTFDGSGVGGAPLMVAQMGLPAPKTRSMIRCKCPISAPASGITAPATCKGS